MVLNPSKYSWDIIVENLNLVCHLWSYVNQGLNVGSSILNHDCSFAEGRLHL